MPGIEARLRSELVGFVRFAMSSLRVRPRAGWDVETIVVAHPQLLTAGHDGFGAIDATTGKIETWMYRIHGSGYRFATYGDIAYLGGNIRNGFDAVAGKKRNNLAAIDLTTNRFTSWAPKIDRYVAVASMGASRGQVLIAGSFSKTLG